MKTRFAAYLGTVVLLGAGTSARAEKLVTLRGKEAEFVWAPAGGALVAARFRSEDVNPLNFEITPDLERRATNAPFLRGHFLCLDRWGAPSAAEQAHGVPFHGEAPRIHWHVDEPPRSDHGRITAEMSCILPLAGLRVAKQIVLDEAGSVMLVTERVTNTNKLGRIYNIVQHPSIAPPFLNEETLVDTNAGPGFVQEAPVPASLDAAYRWPTLPIRGRTADLRRLRDEGGGDTQSDVSSFVFADDQSHGWVTACSPRHRLLLGYVWKTSEYPWLNIWRHRQEGKPAARGLEFGTTGYHQPYPILVRHGPILDRPTYSFLDADETATRSYLCFLARIPADFQGVGELRWDGTAIHLSERREADPRRIELRTSLDFPGK